MRILVLSDRYPPRATGGAGRVAGMLAEGYARRGHDVVVLAGAAEDAGDASAAGDAGPGARRSAPRVFRTGASYLNRSRAYFGLYNPGPVAMVRRLAEQEPFDAVHAHNVHELLSYHALAAAAASAPVLITLHDAMSVEYGKFTRGIPRGGDPDEPVDLRVRALHSAARYRLRYFPLRNRIIRRYLQRRTVARVAVSGLLRRFLETNGVGCTHVIRTGVDPAVWLASPEQVDRFRRSHGVPDGRAALFVGRGGTAKGGPQLLAAMARVAERSPDVRLLLVGREGRWADGLRDRAREAGIADRLVFTGFLEPPALAAAYAAAGVVVLTSIHLDAFGLVPLEAMAAGTPVVVSRFAGIAEIVEEGVTGHIVDPFDIATLAGRIRALLDEPDRARAMGAAARRAVEARHTLARTVDRYLELLDAAGARKDPGQ